MSNLVEQENEQKKQLPTTSVCPLATDLNDEKSIEEPLNFRDDEGSSHLISLQDAQADQIEDLLIRKLRSCCKVFNFHNMFDEMTEKKAKFQQLKDLVGFLARRFNVLTKEIYPEIVHMFTVNIFRHSPPSFKTVNLLFELEEEPKFKPSWTHEKLVFDLFINFIESNDFDPAIGKLYLDHKFILELLSAFDTDDRNHRDKLRIILNRIYWKMIDLRTFIRSTLYNIVYRIIYESEEHNGIIEIMKIFRSVSIRFTSPFNEEQKRCLLNVLVPLHKTKNLCLYHDDLIYCVIKMLEKDSSLFTPVVERLLKYWPKVDSQKEVLFLISLEEITNVITSDQFKRLMIRIFDKISICISSPSFQVAERALIFLVHNSLIDLIKENITILLPIIFTMLVENYNSHWNKNIHYLIEDTEKFYLQIDEVLFDTFWEDHLVEEQKREQQLKKHNKRWSRVQQAALANPLAREFITPLDAIQTESENEPQCEASTSKLPDVPNGEQKDVSDYELFSEESAIQSSSKQSIGKVLASLVKAKPKLRRCKSYHKF